MSARQRRYLRRVTKRKFAKGTRVFARGLGLSGIVGEVISNNGALVEFVPGGPPHGRARFVSYSRLRVLP